jgi:starvation-inducible DNA-binding protein
MMQPTRNSLSESIRSEMTNLLAPTLATCIDLALQLKQAHWNVKGPRFIALHELFDSLAGELNASADELAERIVAIGGIAAGTNGAVQAKSILPAYDVTLIAEVGHLTAIANGLALFGGLVRRQIDEAAAAGDADTADLLTGLSRDTDKQLWFVEAHLQG